MVDFLNIPVRKIRGMVEVYSSTAPMVAYTNEDNLISFEIEKSGDESKFFGYSICQKANFKLRDKERAINITTANTIQFWIDEVGGTGWYSCGPVFYVSEVHRDENTNELSITCYDKIDRMSGFTVGDLGLPLSYTIEDVIDKIATLMGSSYTLHNFPADDYSLALEYPTGANLEGGETVRELINYVAEATQSVAYMCDADELNFKRLNPEETAYEITKEKYFTLDTRSNRRLGAICHATELGDNVIAEMTVSGTTQYVRDNPFWNMREDIDEIVEAALTAVGGFTINQFDCSWRGDLLQLGQRIALTTKDDEVVYSYVLTDKISYNGAFSEQTSWSYIENADETASNPSTLGAALRQTFARVDKSEREIELVASEAEANANDISSLILNTESINASVMSIRDATTETIEGLAEEVATLTSKVNAAITAEDVRLEIQSELELNGANKITTATGFTFNEEGLTVSKSDSEMTTQITEDGMKVYRDNTEVLTADNVGVKATNLHAVTYLIIGKNSRFEDMGSTRTGCFWIGG